MNDILIYETKDGGDILFKNGDLQRSSPLFQQFYLSRFGGKDHWANKLFHSNNEPKQYNSTCQDAIDGNAINSAGRNVIKRAAEKDVKYLSKYGTVTTEVSLIGVDKIKIFDKFQQGIVSIIWDAAKDEVIEIRDTSGRSLESYLIEPEGSFIIDPETGDNILIP